MSRLPTSVRGLVELLDPGPLAPHEPGRPDWQADLVQLFRGAAPAETWTAPGGVCDFIQEADVDQLAAELERAYLAAVRR